MSENIRAKSNPLVSIVVAVYNMGDSIQRCVQSFVHQDYENKEIILVDDGSSDDSLDQCLSLAKRYSCIKVIHTENKGAGPARNKGISVASGDYIYFPDADDILEVNSISVLVQAITSVKGCDLVVFGFIERNQKNKTILIQKYQSAIKSGDELRQNYSDCMSMTAKWSIQGAPWNKFFDLTIIKKNSIEFPPLRRHQDEAFIARYMCVAQSVYFIEDVLYVYYVNDTRKEWQKYPVDYIKSVVGLYKCRKDTILKWNANDVMTHNIIQKEYVNNIIKAMELSFSPKMKFNKIEHIKWLKNVITDTNIGNIDVFPYLGIYQKIVITAIKLDIYVLYMILYLKVLTWKIFK